MNDNSRKPYKLFIWLQEVDEHGLNIGEPMEAVGPELAHAQMTDEIEKVVIETNSDLPVTVRGPFIVQGRRWSGYFDAYGTGRNLTLFVRRP